MTSVVTDADYYDLDDEERYGSLPVFQDRDTGEEYTINPFTNQRNYLGDEDEN